MFMNTGKNSLDQIILIFIYLELSNEIYLKSLKKKGKQTILVH
ncbi:hypothetical protein JCM19300_1718 [Algibacter lectus]|uniref:Uncharacterized protein n=1 Tax=Algibacter lectus TaxID=221126 RepID=A0A090W771_9FLAO|nr:hypothetical protein JCM19300_1718 [Algibacter lectus]GAL80853.1 hypothetical protein JCM19274_1479 [Algibacter lectus]